MATLVGGSAARAQDKTAEAREHYERGLKLVDDMATLDLALAEFRKAYALEPAAGVLHVIAQCEYQRGEYRAAQADYRSYLESPDRLPRLEEIARARLALIDARKTPLVINASVEEAVYRLEGTGPVQTGQLPATLELARGKYRLTVSKPNHTTITREIEVGFDPVPQFFPLEKIRARLEITTRTPADETKLYVDGNLVRNPYRQDVEPRTHEIFVQAKDHLDLPPFKVTLGPGQRLILDGEHDGVLPAGPYRRPGKPELVAWSSAIGATVGASAVFAFTDGLDLQVGTLVFAMGAVGALGGAVASSIVAPSDISDDQALFVIAGMTVGAAEGTLLAYGIRPTLNAALAGGLLGLGAGTAVGATLVDHNPRYRREVFTLGSSLIGLSGGLLLNSALNCAENTGSTACQARKKDLSAHRGLYALGGLNLGLAGGLAYAYGRDDASQDWSWKHSMLVLMSSVAGVFLGAAGSTLQECLGNGDCDISVTTKPRTARASLATGLAGLAVGVLVTRHFDREEHAPIKLYQPPSGPSATLVPTLLPADPDGRASAPGLAAVGRF